jgi:3-oxoacyl-[acyl-carrier-protein] synthase-3
MPSVTAIAIHLPERTESNADLQREFPTWRMQQVENKTGIQLRHLAAAEECASDLAFQAAEKLFASGACRREEIDYLLFCTQTPDYFLPTSACLLQHRLGLPQGIGALDFNLGCSGYIYGLSLASALIDSGQANHVLLLTADTYSKLIQPADRHVRTIFGDAAAASLVQRSPSKTTVPGIGPFVLGTDGSGGEHLITRAGAFRHPSGTPYLEMNGPEIFQFALRVVPQCVNELLRRAGLELHDIDLFIPHQANHHMLEHLRDSLKISPERFFIGMHDCGNTVSASIPIAMQQARERGVINAASRVMLLGFGVGYSWGACLLR